MLRFLKKIFSPNLLLEKRKFLAGFLLFLIVFSFSPLLEARAIYVSGFFGDVAGRIARAIVALSLQLFVLIAEGVLALGIALLSWVTNWMNSVNYTNPAENELIRIGWTILRDVANIGFILGLIYIGLATALRIAGFQTKKAFASILLLALAINFTPVICGIIVDGANILTNFFLEGLVQWETLGRVFSMQTSALGDALFGPLGIQPILKILMIIAFGLVGGGILILFSILFLIRILAIWILVILSPAAFVAYIFPPTKKWFSAWWNQLLQWSFIGVIGGFFLYLSHWILYLVTEGPNVEGAIPLPALNAGEVAFGNEVAGVFVACLFMIIGLYATLQTSAMGADRVMNFVKSKKFQGALKKAGIKAHTGAAVLAAGAAKGAKEGKGIKGKAKGAFKGIITRTGREEGREAMSKILEGAHVVRPGFYEANKRKRYKVDDEKKRLENLSTGRLKAIVRNPALTVRDEGAKTAAAEVLGKRGKFKFDDKKLEEEIIRRGKIMGANLSDVADSRSDLAHLIESDSDMEERMESLINEGYDKQYVKEIAKRAAITKAVEKLSPKQFTEKSQPVALNEEVLAAVNDLQMEYLGRRGTIEQRKQVAKMVHYELSKLLSLAHNMKVQGRKNEADKLIHNINKLQTEQNFSPDLIT